MLCDTFGWTILPLTGFFWRWPLCLSALHLCNPPQLVYSVIQHIYTIIQLKSVCRSSQTAGRNSCSILSGDVSICSYGLAVHPVTRSRVILFIREKHPKPRECVYLNETATGHWSAAEPPKREGKAQNGWAPPTHRRATTWTAVCVRECVRARTRMCVCVNVCVRARECACACTCACVRMRMCVRACACACACARACAPANVHTCMCVCLCLCVCVCVCACECACVHVRVHCVCVEDLWVTAL